MKCVLARSDFSRRWQRAMSDIIRTWTPWAAISRDSAWKPTDREKPWTLFRTTRHSLRKHWRVRSPSFCAVLPVELWPSHYRGLSETQSWGHLYRCHSTLTEGTSKLWHLQTQLVLLLVPSWNTVSLWRTNRILIFWFIVFGPMSLPGLLLFCFFFSFCCVKS